MDDLWDPQDHEGLRRRIDDGALEEWKRVFPAEYGGVRLEADNLRYVGKDRYSLAEQKRAWLENKVLRRLLKADLRLVDAVTGDELDRRKGITLMSVPHFTDRGTFVHNGNNYTANIQTRMLPGAYTRRQNNGALECFHATTEIWTEQGPMQIGKIVNERLAVRVWSYDFELSEFVLRPVVNWFRNPVREYIGRAEFGKGNRCPVSGVSNKGILWSTPVHKIIEAGGSKREISRCTSPLLAVEDAPSMAQLQVILGSLLGDAHISPGGILQEAHCEAQRAYLSWKREMLGGFVKEGVKDGKSSGQSFSSGGAVCKLFTKTCSAFKRLRDAWYPGGEKRITQNALKDLDPRGMAVWFGDDGTSGFSNNGNIPTACCYVHLATDGFPLEDIEILKGWLAEKWGLKAKEVGYVDSRGGNFIRKYWLGMYGSEAEKFLDLIVPYLHPSLGYKLGRRPPTGSCRLCGIELDRRRKTCSKCLAGLYSREGVFSSHGLRRRFGSARVLKALLASGSIPADPNPGERWDARVSSLGSGLGQMLSEAVPVKALAEIPYTYTRIPGSVFDRAGVAFDIEVEGTHNYFANGILVSNCQFNVRAGTGKVFRVGLDPDDGQFRLRMAGSNLHLYSVLKDLGVTDAALADAWGPGVLEMNKARYDVRASNNLYQKAVPSYVRKEATPDSRNALLLEAFDKSQVARAATDRTLGAYWKKREPEAAAGAEFEHLLRKFLPHKKAAVDLRDTFGDTDDEGDVYHPVGLDGVLAATRKLLAVNRGLDIPDDRNVPSFMKAYPMDKLMREKIRLDEGKLRRGLLRHLSYRRNLDPVRPRFFDPYFTDIITRNPLTSPIEETNPLQLVSQQRRMTAMGPGGIGSSDAITADMQAFQASEVGFISPLEGPECFTGEAEVMTIKGWRRWDTVDLYTEFACASKGRIHWSRSTSLIAEEYSGELVSTFDGLLVTPGHRVFHLDRDGTPTADRADTLDGRPGALEIPVMLPGFKSPEISNPAFRPPSFPARIWIEREGEALVCYGRSIRTRLLHELQSEMGKVVPGGHLFVERDAVVDAIELLAFSVGFVTKRSNMSHGISRVWVGRSLLNPPSLPSTWYRVSYSGKVYCARVPGGMLFVRSCSSGLGHWSGNSERAGIDVRLASGVRIGKDGRLYRQVLDSAGVPVWVTPQQLVGKTLGVPD